MPTRFLCDHVEDASSELSDMCGRNSLFIDQADLEARFDAEVVTDGGYTPRYNIAPGDDLHIVTNDAPDELDAYHWGADSVLGGRARGGHHQRSLRNCRRETRLRAGMGIAPCLVPSSGFYEWKSPNGGTKQPYRIHREDDPAFAMAGLWDVWEGEDETISCVTILTTEPNDLMNSIHDRMPVVLPQDVESDWLAADPDTRKELCQPYPKDDLDAYEISTRVNNPGNDDSQVIEPLDHEQSGLGEFSSG